MPEQALSSQAADRPLGEGVPVRVSVPADKDFVVLIRSAAGHLGAHVGFTMAEITDLRLAVDEACGLLLAPREPRTPSQDGAPLHGELECRFDVTPDALRISVAAAADFASGPDTESFGWSILSALVDSLGWSYDGTTATVDLVKRRGPRDSR